MDRELEHFSAEELIRELEERGYNYVYDEPVDPDEVWFETDVDYKRENLVLPKVFDKNQLVDFLLEAFGLGHYVTNDQLIGRLKDFINN